MISLIQAGSCLHSSIGQQSAASKIPAQQPLAVAFPESTSEAAGNSLKARVTALGPTSKEVGDFEPPEDCEMWTIPSVERSNAPESKSVLPLLLLGKACHDLGLEKLSGKTSQNTPVGGILKENHMQNLLIEAQQKGVNFCKDLVGGVQIKKMLNFSEEEQWECLKKIHDVMPVMHVRCERSENVEALLLFLQSNRGLVSLDLGTSPNMTDEALEEISQHLPGLKSFSIDSAKIAHLPQSICNQVETLQCLSCKMLVSINSPIAITIDCKWCESLTMIEAPAATTVQCNNCTALTTLYAPVAIMIDCTFCAALVTLNAPLATTVRCNACTALTTLNVPAAITIDCKWCNSLKMIEAPAATTVDCWSCKALTALDAPVATTVNCTFCTALVTLNAPLATTLQCNDCTALTAINAPAVTKVGCSCCVALTTLNVPVATRVDCTGCRALTDLSAPAATMVVCRCCRVLATLGAPVAAEAYFDSCTSLTTVDVPVAVEIGFEDCPALTSLNAPAAAVIRFKNCTALTTVDAPVAVEVEFHDCPALTSLNAPAAVVVRFHNRIALTTVEGPVAPGCVGYRAIKTINTPLAEKIDCQSFSAFVNLNAPAATTVDCEDCNALTTLNASAATRINCRGCTALRTLKAAKAVAIVGLADTALTDEARLKVLTSLRRNVILMVCYAQEGQDVEALMQKAGAAQDRPLNRWLTNASRFIPPAYVASKAEESDSKQKIDGFFKDLITLASAEGIVREQSLEWFTALKKLESLQQQMKRVIWLGALLMCSAPGKNLFADPSTLSTLAAIGNLENPFLQQELTRALLSIYDKEASQQLNVWKRGLMGQLKRHQILPHLLFSRADLEEVFVEGLLQTIAPKYYQNTAVLTPILEMLCMLFSLPLALPEKLLKLIFQAPQVEEGGRKDKFRARVTAHRKDQSKLVTGCRDLLFFGKFDALESVKNEGDLLEKHKTICREIFGVREEFVHKFSDSFTSKRYSNALLTYAARLQTLSPDEKELLTHLLGKFVNAHLEGNFPGCRYDLSINPHLNLIFKDDPALLKKWTSPLEIDLADSERLRQSPSSHPCDMIKSRMATAIANRHLGDDPKTTYPTLTKILEDENFETIPSSLIELKAEFDRLQTSDFIEDKQKHLDVEMDCLRALDPTATSAERIGILNSLLEKIPNGLEFSHDVRGILQVLQSRKVSLQKIESTDFWEDLLLMGTEVSNSCQRIDGGPYFNKCLLSYILDGKNKAIIVRNAEGKIAARSVLRILWSQKHKSPVLFMEHIYTRTGISRQLSLHVDDNYGCRLLTLLSESYHYRFTQ